MATRLLKAADGRIAGAIGVNTRTGEFLVVRAKAVILAAGQSQGLLPLTENLPKTMLDIKGKSILERQIDVLNACGVQDFASVNVLADAEIREGIKQYASWPTIPQIYIDGKAPPEGG